MKNIFENSNAIEKEEKGRCLCLIDEIIKGTKYKEELALSIASIQQLARIKGKTVCLISDRFLFSLLAKEENISLCDFEEEEENKKKQE